MSNVGQLSAFKADCETLIECYVSSDSTTFHSFCTAWFKMNFSYVFHGYSTHHELVHFLEDAFVVVKHCFLKSTTLLQKIGSIYLMYSIYYKQPTQLYNKFRFTASEWAKFNDFYEGLVPGNDHDQARLIFWTLLKDKAFQLVEAEYEYGFERFMHKDSLTLLTRSEYQRYAPVIATQVGSLESASTGVISALGILQLGYNEMKEHLDVTGPSKGLLPPTSILSDITTSMENIKKYWKIGENLEPTVDSYSESEGGANDVTEDPGRIGLRRVQLKKTGWRSKMTAEDLISKAKATVSFKEYSRKEKRDQLQELRRRTVQRQLIVPENLEAELEQSSDIELKYSAIDLPNMPTQIL